MPSPRRGPRLGAGPDHERLLLGTLAEHLITFAKRGDVHARRQVLRTIPDRDVVHKLFSEIGPRFAERQGGYTRILKLGQRSGDGASMALIELLPEEE